VLWSRVVAPRELGGNVWSMATDWTELHKIASHRAANSVASHWNGLHKSPHSLFGDWNRLKNLAALYGVVVFLSVALRGLVAAFAVISIPYALMWDVVGEGGTWEFSSALKIAKGRFVTICKMLVGRQGVWRFLVDDLDDWPMPVMV
jgi:hypothetical protein